jgi:Flp pilus assembly protein TadD
MEMNRPADALREFGRALALDPASALAHNNRGVALLSLGQREVAREDFERALEIDACLFDPRHNLRQMGLATEPPPGCRFTADQRRLLGVGR